MNAAAKIIPLPPASEQPRSVLPCWGEVNVGRFIVGFLSEAELAGVRMLRIQEANGEGQFVDDVLRPAGDVKMLRLLSREEALQRAERVEMTLELIQRFVCEGFEVVVPQLNGQCKLRSLVDARFAFYLLARRWTSLSLDAIAKFCGGRDHGTAASGAHRAAELLEVHPSFREKFRAVEAALLRHVPHALKIGKGAK